MLLLIQKWKCCNLKYIEEDGNMYSNYIFHVHTRRCKHASDENNEKYNYYTYYRPLLCI